jgi:CHAT domain/AAA domain
VEPPRGGLRHDLGAAIATRLLQEGIASVVAMAYTVYAVAAAEFMAAFYERLFVGDPVSAAVTAGRKRLSARNGRPSRKGDMPLEDWLIPVHYLRRDISFPQVRVDRTGPLSLDEELDQIRAAASGQGTEDLDPVGTFTGRDWLTCQLEVAARLQKVVVLYGPGGTGKTELVKAFGRWWRDTGGVEDPRFVFFHSFEPGVATFGLDGVVNEIGRSLFGTEFDRQQPAERRAVVEKVLTERRMLLIWDNFETVRSMPESKSARWGDASISRRGVHRSSGSKPSHLSSVVSVKSRRHGWGRGPP